MKISKLSRSFTLIEVIVVMGVMGLIIGGLLVSMRQIIEGEILLKKMQAVEEESRFIMDLFAQDAQYSELDDSYKESLRNDEELLSNVIRFVLTEKREDIGQEVNNISEYQSYEENTSSGKQYYLVRSLADDTEDLTTTLNNTPLELEPKFRIRKIVSNDGAKNYMITISLTFKIENRGESIPIPVQTSVVSRTFEI